MENTLIGVFVAVLPKQHLDCFYFEGGAWHDCDLNNAAWKSNATKGALWTIVILMMLPGNPMQPREHFGQ
eukprot:11295808-Ditylum_brightwellii.AAC.1